MKEIYFKNGAILVINEDEYNELCNAISIEVMAKNKLGSKLLHKDDVLYVKIERAPLNGKTIAVHEILFIA